MYNSDKRDIARVPISRALNGFGISALSVGSALRAGRGAGRVGAANPEGVARAVGGA